MSETINIPEHLTSRLRWLMFSRVMIASFLLALAAFVEIKGMGSLLEISASLLFKTILVAYILSVFFLFLLRHLKSIPINMYIQSICDIALITTMVYATGGIRSIYSIFYPLVIIYSVLFLGRRGGFIVASAAGVFYGFLADLEFHRVIYPHYSASLTDYPMNAADVITRIVTHFLSFYLIAFLASFVVEQERKTRNLLVEKQSAFDQLDLLHRSIIESVDNGILTVDLEGRIKSFNRAAARITGFTFRDIENRKFSELFPGSPSIGGIQGADEKVPLAKTQFEMLFPTGSGKRLVLGGSVSTLRDPHGVTIGSIVIFQDLTEINEMKESLEKSRQLAFIGEIAANLAHEIRNPLAAISGSIQMLKGALVRDGTNARLIQIILRAKDHLEGFLKDFLLMARPARGPREALDIRETIREIVESLRCIDDWHKLHDVVMVLADDPLYIRANKTEVRQILWNLMLNAVQAMPAGGVLKVEARPARVEEGDGAEISIGDTGCGIEEQDFSKIFDPFYTTRDMGTGLGLAVVKRILEAYGGAIRMKSKPGEGSVFTIWLPVDAKVAAVTSSYFDRRKKRDG
jgi:two-component system sensor histidine kinase PilS (NtrC family)